MPSVPASRPVPLLALAMIVRNEAHGIAATLRSFKPFVDRWVILDTGSTDGTQDIIRAEMDRATGALHDGEFVDFSSARNRVLDYICGGAGETHWANAEFAIMPDADDILVGGHNLRSALHHASREIDVAGVHQGDNAFLVNLRRGNLDYYLPLVTRTSARCRYRGRVHECLDYVANVRVPGVTLTQQAPAQSAEASRKRWERDEQLLRADLDADPNNHRAAFYLAQTLECLGKPDLAEAFYQYRIRIRIPGGWPDETFEAMRRRARVLHTLGRPWPEVEAAHLAAHAFDPRRAEPLAEVAEHYRQKDEHALAYIYASRAATLPRPDTSMFVDADVYEWSAADTAAISAFYLGQKTRDVGTLASGKVFAERCVRARPDDERLRATRAFYAPSAAALFRGDVRIQPIDYTPEKPYHTGNCSVHYDRIGAQWRCLLRTANYEIVNGEYLTPDDNVIFTKNVMLELGPDLSTRRGFPLRDCAVVDRTDFPVHGYEDCRMWVDRHHDGSRRFYASATVCDLANPPAGGKGQREIVRLELADPSVRSQAYDIIRVDRLPVWNTHAKLHQKNWMPILCANGGAWAGQFVYSTEPLSVCGPMGDREGPSSLGRLRGGSQVIAVPDGFLALVHDVTFPGGASRIYLHRFVKFDPQMSRVVAMTEPFYFMKRGIEFCAGLALGLGPDGTERLVASFSVDDRSSFFAIFSPGDVYEQLRTTWVV